MQGGDAIYFYCRKCRHVFAADDPACCPRDGGLLIRFANRIPLVGETVGFRYLLTGLIGDGGVCSIFSAADKAVKRRVAIKIMHPDMAVQDCWRDALMNEVALARRISQENMVPVHQGGISDGGYVFMVMDLLEGESLAARLSSRGRMGIADSCQAALGTARALAAVHAAGHVHRDVKPENIFICGPMSPRGLTAGSIRLMDLGVARPINAPAQGATVDGTPAYMSPEQVSGLPVDERSDIYSLGVVLFEMLTGRPCFDAASPSEVMLAHVREPAPLLPDSILGSAMGPDMAALVGAMLEKAAESRPGKATLVATRLEQIHRLRSQAVELPFSMQECI